MNKIYYIALLIMITTATHAQKTFKSNQLSFKRVRKAYDKKGEKLQIELERSKFTSTFQLFIAAYKAEGKLEVWLKGNGQNQFKLFKVYNFCAYSGALGPKVVEGDKQTPEGFYRINVFNPMSNFHLSLGIDYPNSIDLVRTGKNRKPGNHIYIHGDCQTIRCIPITDEKIKELYVIAVEARNHGQTDIPVHIFPFRMTEQNIKKYIIQFPDHAEFWRNLQHGYAYFEKYKTLPAISKAGSNYVIK